MFVCVCVCSVSVYMSHLMNKGQRATLNFGAGLPALETGSLNKDYTAGQLLGNSPVSYSLRNTVVTGPFYCVWLHLGSWLCDKCLTH